jgi:linoleoyl-CoA desaturase
MSGAELKSEGLAAELGALGREARSELGVVEVRRFDRLRKLSRLAEALGRTLLITPSGPLGFCSGVFALTFHLGLEAQLNHSVMHGAYAGLPGASHLDPKRYETLALPMRSETWRIAHKLHHAEPSVLGRDPDTVHPLFRVHDSQRWRPWHLLNPVLGGLFVFECWAFDYDALLKQRGLRRRGDRSELSKLLRFWLYQFALFAMVAFAAGFDWHRTLWGTLFAVVARNYVFVALQTGSSVGDGISTWHANVSRRPQGDAWYRFQIETSKNYPLPAWATLICGGLDRHIEHHLWPNLPPERLRAISPRVKSLCERHGVRYVEHRSALASYADSFRYLLRLARPGRN